MKANNWLKSELANNIWNRKYKYEDETFEQWLERVSGGNDDLKHLMQEKKFLFAGRILSNRGLQHKGVKCTFSNCYVLDAPQDNLESIYKTASELARTFSYGGGVGIDLANLRPRNAKVNNSARHTTGAVSFMPTYSEVTGTIGQNNRRGALMISMPIDHPDIEEFIDVKKDLNAVTKANISVRVNAEFMEAVKNNQDFICKFTVEDTGEVITKVVNAKNLFMKLCENNWDYAEPGILYWDNIENWNVLSEYKDFKYAGVNPCAEEPLPAGGSCLLGSLNLSEFVKEPFTSSAYFDWEEFVDAIYVAVKGLNDVLDEGLDLHPLQIQKDTVHSWRQIGLGVMGIADMLIKLDMGYGSKESIDFCEKVARLLADTSINASSLLAKEYGSFPKFDLDATLKSPYVKEVCSKVTIENIKTYGLRNSQLLTIAPTGTLSTMLEISGGIEPIFNTSYIRKTESLGDGDQYYTVYTPIIKQYMDAKGLTDESQIPNHIKVTAMTLKPLNRVEMQSIWQKYIDASISSTVNLPNEATIEDVYNIYMYAHEKGLKGITVFRDGCKRLAILSNTTPSKEEEKEEKPLGLARGELKDIAEDTTYHRRPVNIGCGSLHLFIGYSESEQSVQDLIIKKSDGGGCEKNIETTVMGIAMILRLGGTLEMIDKQFNSISTCASFTRTRERGLPISRGNCCGNAIMNVIKDFLKGEKPVKIQEKSLKTEKTVKKVVKTEEKSLKLEETVKKVVKTTQNNQISKPQCPECKAEINMVEGCMTCPHCGYSKCS